MGSRVSLAGVPNSGMIVPDMGNKTASSPPQAPTTLASALFTPVQQRVLGLLFGQTQQRFQSAELIRLAGSGTGATHRVLRKLADSGLVRVSMEGRQKYYQANPDCPVFEELAGLVRKTVGLVGPIREALVPLADEIHAAFVFGSVASGRDRAESDIDLMVISDALDYPTVIEAAQSAEAALARPVNPNLMTLEDWRSKASRRGGFVDRVRGQSRLFVVGSEDDLK